MSLGAVIFDLDGVVTDTAKVHFKAWKELFDNYLQEYSQQQDIPFEEFTEEDYLTHVDGIPRFEGVKRFLHSREVDLPLGEPNDALAQQTIYGLGNHKNKAFNEVIKRDGVKLFASTIELIKQLRQQNIKTAIVSSSRNCKNILKAANIEHLFDARVDGLALDELGLPGKPAPDMFTEAAKLIKVDPLNTAALEDAILGVQACRAGGFGLVIGIDRTGIKEQLLQQGADMVVSDLAEISLAELEQQFSGLPSALEHKQQLIQQLQDKKIAIFLDYDGTLTPIVATPDLAVLSDEMRDCLQRLGNIHPTILVSGRMLSNLHNMVQLDELYYAGNHGFEIEGPHHSHIKSETGAEFHAAIDQAFEKINAAIADIEGLLIEHKKFSLSVHYRLVDSVLVPKIEAVIDKVLAEQAKLRKHHGKKVFEIRPNIAWDKGKAVLWLLKTLKLDQPNVIPIYIGDDVTDEDAFKALKKNGIGISVSEQAKPSAASYALHNTNEVKQFLELLIGMSP